MYVLMEKYEKYQYFSVKKASYKELCKLSEGYKDTKQKNEKKKKKKKKNMRRQFA